MNGTQLNGGKLLEKFLLIKELLISKETYRRLAYNREKNILVNLFCFKYILEYVPVEITNDRVG